jgi:2-polyprenyl-3-methyl-5-hydroxy-6-metoxy-1,4-benzoquinol methylase
MEKIFSARVLNKYDVKYFQCSSCRFIQTEKPYWLEEAYGDVIADLDIGYVTRNVSYSEIVNTIIKLGFNSKLRFLDYGGGYGIFVRLMRDKGIEFFRQDKYCGNLFSKYLDVNDQHTQDNFELMTAFEVFEHLEDPMREIEEMFTFSDSILFSTVIQPKYPLKNSKDWWYFMPETGQHVAFYSKESLRHIADSFNCNIYSNGRNLHLLTKKNFTLNPIKIISYAHYAINIIFNRHFSNRKSLISKDFEDVKRHLKIDKYH